MRWDRLAGLALLVGAAFALGMAFLTFLRRPSAEPIEIIPPVPTVTSEPTATPVPTATAGPLVIYVSGAVVKPDVYRLAPGSIADDAVNAAGGFAINADPVAINLALSLIDGMQLHVPALGETPVALPEPPPPSASRGGELFSALVNLNTANAAELESLPGIGPALAERILAYRDENGTFATIEQIMEVSGIGEATFEALRELVGTGP